MGEPEHEDRTVEVLRDRAEVEAAVKRWEAKGWQLVHSSAGSWERAIRLHLQRPVKARRRTR